jgi:predicted nucleotidyltransferase/DNA-binding XRE family transcriptional regulator
MARSAAATLRDARSRAGLTQMELARRAGITQSVVSAYESGHRQPSLPTLSSLVAAAGFELRLQLADPVTRLTGPIGRRVRKRRSEILDVATRHGVDNLRVFGSVARGEDREDSDVDLLVDVPAGLGLLGFGRLASDLEKLLGARVDLIPSSDLKPDVRARVEAELVPL